LLRTGVVTRHIVSISTALVPEVSGDLGSQTVTASGGGDADEVKPGLDGDRLTGSQHASPNLLESQTAPAERAEGSFGLIVVSADLPEGYLARSLEPLVASTCRVVITVGGEARSLETRYGASPQWNEQVEFTSEYAPTEEINCEILLHQDFSVEERENNGNDFLPPDKSITWRACLSCQEIQTTAERPQDTGGVKIPLLDPEGRPSRASLTVVFPARAFPLLVPVQVHAPNEGNLNKDLPILQQLSRQSKESTDLSDLAVQDWEARPHSTAWRVESDAGQEQREPTRDLETVSDGDFTQHSPGTIFEFEQRAMRQLSGQKWQEKTGRIDPESSPRIGAHVTQEV